MQHLYIDSTLMQWKLSYRIHTTTSCLHWSHSALQSSNLTFPSYTIAFRHFVLAHPKLVSPAMLDAWATMVANYDMASLLRLTSRICDLVSCIRYGTNTPRRGAQRLLPDTRSPKTSLLLHHGLRVRSFLTLHFSLNSMLVFSQCTVAVTPTLKKKSMSILLR